MKTVAVAVLAAAAVTAALPAAADTPACPIGAAYEAIETSCDGIDNDCDGLVDVLVPVADNECTPPAPSCEVGHAACMGGARVCLAPGPAPEVVDGKDNDCNGVVDDVPAATVRDRALLLVPGYLFSDGAPEIDNIASMLDAWGIAYDRPTSPDQFDAALSTLGGYPLVVVPGYLEDDFVTPARQAALEAYAEGGGILVVFKPIFDAASAAQALTGTSATVRRSDVERVVFDGAPAAATRAFDAPEEVDVPLNAPTSGVTVWTHVLTPAGATQALASAVVGGASVGAAVTRRPAGRGAVYALGQDLHTSYSTRCYVNCFEPAGDMAGLFLREAFREGTRGHVVVKHSVPGTEDSLTIVSHDLCAEDAQQPAPEWGDPGALQVARLESGRGARGSFMVTTDYTAEDGAYYSPGLVRSLCALGMCPVGVHSVVHGEDFASLPTGSCTETQATYDPLDAPTLCGEVRVAEELVTAAAGTAPVAWRSPFLYVNPAQYDVLASEGLLFDSSYGVGDLKFNLPLSLARTGINQYRFHSKPLYSMPIALEDGIDADAAVGRIEMSAGNAAEFETLWTYAMLRNADNGAHTMALLHPSYGVNAPIDNLRNKLVVLDRYLGAAAKRGVRTDRTMADVAAFWRAREETAIDATYDGGVYRGTIRTGAHAMQGLTLEFGDAIGAFSCDGCGDVTIAGRRVAIPAAIPPATVLSFEAPVVATAPPPAAVPAARPPWLAVLGAAFAVIALVRNRAARI